MVDLSAGRSVTVRRLGVSVPVLVSFCAGCTYDLVIAQSVGDPSQSVGDPRFAPLPSSRDASLDFGMADSRASVSEDGIRDASTSVDSTDLGPQPDSRAERQDALAAERQDALPPVPRAAFVAPASGVAPFRVAFTNASTGTIDQYEWQFGDGASSSSESPSHTFEVPGDYTVRLAVSGPGGSDTAQRSVVVRHSPPRAVFLAPANGQTPFEVRFTNRSVGEISSYAWDFGDGGTSTAAAPTHIFEFAGTYAVRLTVTGPGGTDSVQRSIEVTVGPFWDIVANIYRRQDGNGAVHCVVRSHGYWDLGDYAACFGGTQPLCQRGATRVDLDATDEADGSHKQHYGCLIRRAGDNSTSVRVVALMLSDSNGVQNSCNASAYWDLGTGTPGGPYADCDNNNVPVCRRGSLKLVLAMARMANNRVKYHTACVLPGSAKATNIVAVIHSTEVFGSADQCSRGAIRTPTAESPWDLANYSQCAGGRPVCHAPSRRITLRMTRRQNYGIDYRFACVVDDVHPAGQRHLWDWIANR